MNVCNKYRFENLCLFESGVLSEARAKGSFRENRLGLSENCIGCGYDTVFCKRKKRKER